MKRSLAALVTAVLSLALLSACAPEDKTPPAPPFLEPLASPTDQAAPRLEGTAEFGALVTITGGTEEITTTADPYTARFAVEVPLSEGINNLSVTATDAAGNVSEPSLMEVEYIVPPGPPVRVELNGPTSVQAGRPATFIATAWDVFGNEIPEPALMITSDAPAGTTAFEAPGTFTFCDVGTWVVTASSGDGGPSAEVEITVTLGAPVAVTLTTDPTPATIVAGETVGYTTEVVDICGNVTDDPVDVFTSAPGAVAVGGTISGLTRSGAYTIAARVAGTGVEDTEMLVIGPDESMALIDLSLSTGATSTGLPVGYATRVVDTYGNAITGDVVLSTDDPGAVIDEPTRSITFAAPGVRQVTATITLGGVDFTDTEFVVIRFEDIGDPGVTIESPTAGAILTAGTRVPVVVHATDDVGLAELIFEASGAASTRQTHIFPAGSVDESHTFLLDLPRNAAGEIRLVAQVVDTSGRLTRSVEVLVTAEMPLFGVNTLSGFAITAIAGGDLLDGPRGLVVNMGEIYVANSNQGDILRIDVSSGRQITLAVTPGNPTDLVYDPTTTNFYATLDNGRIARVPGGGGVGELFSNNLDLYGLTIRGSELWSISINFGGGGNSRLYRFDPAAAPIASPNCNADTQQTGGRDVVFLGTERAIFTEDGGTDTVRRTVERPRDRCGNNLDSEILATADFGQVDRPRAVVLAASNNLYYANSGNGRVMRILNAGSCPELGCTVETVVSGLRSPWGLAFDATESALYVSDDNDDVIFAITTTGTF